ncbi:MAG: alanine dehydrogenase [Cytophagales bacterium]|nr:alanine dehydrogenase [Cytophagales bacterium]
MVIGVPRELKNSESRVALTPAGAFDLKQRQNHVLVQSSAGENSGFTDEDYRNVGVEILPTAEEVYARSEMILKVKEPLQEEYKLINSRHLVFCFFHFASSRELTLAMKEQKATCLAFETVEERDGTLPLLIPMSEVAGRMSIQQGAKYLEKPHSGFGILLGGVPGVPPARVLIIGGGVVGMQAAKMAAGLGADVTMLDLNLSRLRYLADIMPPNVKTMISNEYNIRKLIKRHPLIVGAVLVPGAKAPKLISRDMLKDMLPGTVLVDVAVDQGGCFETTVPTTHQNPTYTIDNVIHYSVANMPGAVPHTSTLALANATLPYVIRLAENGWKAACQDSKELQKGLNLVHGKAVYPAVAEDFGLPYVPVSSLIK